MNAGPELKRELGLGDVTLFAIACMVGTRWIAAAAHAGPGSLALWLLTAVFFTIPLAVAVGSLAVAHPKAGGLYHWARADFGPWHGFLCGWVYWIGLAVWFPSAAMFYMQAALTAVGLPSGRAPVLGASLAAIAIALGTNLAGMRIGKWTENVGGLSAWGLAAGFVTLAVLVVARRPAATAMHWLPEWNWGTVNFWATIAYAMSGLELAGLMAAEVHDPERTFPRAGWISSLCTIVFYSAATMALLALLPPERITEMNGLADAGGEAGRALGARWLGPAVALLVAASGMGQLGGIGASISRIPFAAAADGLLPAAFARVHPRWRTPYISILVLGGVSFFLLLAMQLGDSMRSAYQELVSLMIITGFLPYLYIFASSWRAGNRWSAAAGWATVVLTILCAIVPPGDIGNAWLFEGKLTAGTLATAGSAWLVYRRRRPS